MKKTILLLVCLFLSFNSNSKNTKCVILLHGLARSHHAMSSIATALTQHDYIVVNENYPSTKKPIQDIANEAIQPMINQCLAQQATDIMFVTHSLGGLIIQAYLKNHTLPQLSHIVMLSPPNHGSPLADLLHHFWLFKHIMGPAGQELTTDSPIIFLSNKAAPYKIGIIAGSFNLLPFSDALFHEKNDGKVSVSSAKLTAMDDFIILPVTHTFMMHNTMVKKQILYFLKHNKFSHND